MQEPTTYCGASSRHVHCENYKFEPNNPLNLFQKDEIWKDVTWLDIKNCCGTLDQNSFNNIPNLEIININHCDFEKILENTFSTLKNLKSIDMCRSTVPVTLNTFGKCDTLENLRFIKLKNYIKESKIFENLNKLEYLMYHDIEGLNITSDTFFGLKNLKYLFITKCTVNSLSKDAFEPLQNLANLYFTGNTVKGFDSNAFLVLKSLKVLGVNENVSNNSENLQIDYQAFQNLPALEIIGFPEENLQKLDFENFKNLKKIQLVIGKTSENIIKFLEGKRVDFEWTTDTDLSVEPDFSDTNIQICA